jgi:phosphoglycerol transferase
VPQLGAPFTGNWNDFPLTEKPFFTLAGMLANIIGLFAAANLTVLIGQVLAAEAFYLACRVLGANWIWAFAGAVVFAFSHYAFAHGFNHIIIMYYWHVPLGLLVVEWVIRGKGLHFWERNFIYALVIAVIFGIQNQYFCNLFVQLVCLGGLVQVFRRGWREVLPSAAVAATAVAFFFLMNFNTILYGLIYGPNTEAVVRIYRGLEKYGLKLVDLILPPPDHRFAPFASWSTDHLANVLLPPGEWPPAQYIGLIGMVALVWLVVLSLRRLATGGRAPLETWLIMWVLLYSEVGGLNCIAGSFGAVLFRATSRYSIFIICILLMFAVRQLSSINFRNRTLIYATALFVVLIAIWDQTPPFVSSDAIAATAQAVASDRHFVEAMEKHLPPNAMIFQVPVADFPESPVAGNSSYENLRPYLFSNELRFAFGSDKGRPDTQWQVDLQRKPVADAVADLERYGFAAFYINRDAFADQGEGFVTALKKWDAMRSSKATGKTLFV